ncbi:hypothetical protein CTEN210_09683 [Chaetoceros tenuissimus]|uniref:HSF-type DNA-binding domain-containing protein n=1 Tax=Chaetoceros tenuissimus TaxID=426638 RepID=A0AAD3H793_9STRA|nr:hypothetical protein CTEN210_09683 [Chaetoceros tenuissimus]
MSLVTSGNQSILSNSTMFQSPRDAHIDLTHSRNTRQKIKKVQTKKSGSAGSGTYQPTIGTKKNKIPKRKKAGIANAFPSRLHNLLGIATENKHMRRIISWHPDGSSCFRVHNKKAFTRDIQPRYFKQSKYTSFRRQLNLWEFQRINDGDRKGYYAHPSFVRQDRSRCYEMKRVKVKGESQTAATKPEETASKQQENTRKLVKTVSLSSVEEDYNVVDVKDADMKVDDAIIIRKHTGEEDISASSVHSLECTVVTADTDEHDGDQEQEIAQEEALERDPDLPEVSPQESYLFFMHALVFVDSITH